MNLLMRLGGFLLGLGMKLERTQRIDSNAVRTAIRAVAPGAVFNANRERRTFSDEDLAPCGTSIWLLHDEARACS